jgi:hypothetical protein
LDTAIRGSRKEFPAVAVIIAESNKVTIYDGDNTDLPMWRVFSGIDKWAASFNDLRAIAMLNGVLVIGNHTSGIYAGTWRFNFVSDDITGHRGSSQGRKPTSGGITATSLYLHHCFGLSLLPFVIPIHLVSVGLLVIATLVILWSDFKRQKNY